MYKVMVVDDELWGRRAISKMIGELSLDVEVIAEAKHGEEALKLIEVNKPHIVVTDMNMPVMDGLNFLESLHTRYSDIRVIVISGYSQFEYLRAAIRYQACEYLLKPVARSDLRSAVIKAAELSRSYKSLQQQKKEAQDLLKLKRGVFLQNVTSRRIMSRSDMDRQLAELKIPEEPGSFRLVVMMFRHFQETAQNHFHGNAELLLFSIENILHEILRDDLALVYKSDDRLRICLLERAAGSGLPGWLPAFHEAVQRLRLEVRAGISPAFSSLPELPEAFRMAGKAIAEGRLNASGPLINHAEAAAGPPGPELLTSFELQAIRQAMASGNAKDARNLVNHYLEKLEGSHEVTVGQVHQELARILDAAVAELKGLATLHPSVFNPEGIAGILDAGEVRRLLTGWMEVAEEWGTSRKEQEPAPIIEQMINYLDLHYFEDISLIDVATRFHLDPSYLSKLFKSVTSENFIEYLTRRRIEKACELLRTSDRRISDISELVGYENQRYFSQVFKKSTGQTPSEYREMHPEPS